MISLSWSRFKIHKTCALQYHLKYVQKVRLHKSNLLFLVGSTVHDSVHNWTRNGYKENIIKDVTINFFDSMSKGFKLTKEKRGNLLKQSIKASVIAERLYRRLGIPEHNACVEERFNQPFGDDRLIGVIDVLDLSINAVYDLKNYTKDPTNYEDGQLYTYALSQELKGQPVEFAGFITPLLEDKIHLFSIDDIRMEEFKEELVEALNDMKNPKSREPTVSDQCYFCDYYRTSYCSATNDKKDEKEVQAYMDPVKARKMMRKMNLV